MLDPKVISEVKRHLAAGLKHRKIAALTGASRATVGNIARGRRADKETEGWGGRLLPGSTTRCPGCGGKQVTPCRVCLARAALKGRSGAQTPDIALSDLQIDLRGEARARYEKIRQQKAEADQGGELMLLPDAAPNPDWFESDEDEAAANAFTATEDRCERLHVAGALAGQSIDAVGPEPGRSSRPGPGLARPGPKSRQKCGGLG